jgi:hypothetical protein
MRRKPDGTAWCTMPAPVRPKFSTSSSAESDLALSLGLSQEGFHHATAEPQRVVANLSEWPTIIHGRSAIRTDT